MWLWKIGPRPAATVSSTHGDEWPDEPVDPLGWAMVGVEGDVDRVLVGHHVGELGEGSRAHGHVPVRLAGGELTRAVGELDDPVRPGCGEAFQCGHDRRRRSGVDGGQGVSAGTCGVEHLTVFLGGGDRHPGFSYRLLRLKVVAPLCRLAVGNGHL